MRHLRRAVASCVCLSLALSGFSAPALAQGLIPTERLVAAPGPAAPAEAPAAALPAAGGSPAQAARPPLPTLAERIARRAALNDALVAGGVEPAQAQARVAALTDAEIARLSAEFDSAPAGGMWFVPFLVVAAMIGALIGTREPGASSRQASSDLFGRPRGLVAAP